MCEPKSPEQLAKEGVTETLLEQIRTFPEDGKFQLIITEQTQELPSPLPPYNFKGVRHVLQSVPALADLLTKHGSAAATIVYFNEANINAILDQTVQDRPFDTAVYAFEASAQAADWRGKFDKGLNQRDFIKFLKAREPGEVPEIEVLMAAAQQIKANFKVVHEVFYTDSNNRGITYKIDNQEGKGDEGKLMLPTRLEITMPLLKESEELFTVDVDLELTIPVDGNAPYFTLTCPRWATFWREAVEKAVQELRDRLPGYLIVAGEGFKTN